MAPKKHQPTGFFFSERTGNGAQPKGAGAVDASRWRLQQFDQQGGLPQQQGRQCGHQETLQGRGKGGRGGKVTVIVVGIGS